LVHSRRIVGFVCALFASLEAGGCLGKLEPTSCGPTTPIHDYAVGSSVGDTLTGQTCRHLYQFTTAGQVTLRFKLTSPGFQTYMQLYDHRSAIIMNSTLSAALDTTTTVRMILGPGTYGLAVAAVNAGTRGTFSLVAAADTAPVSGCGTVWMTTGIVTTQTLTTADCTQGPGGAAYYYHVYAVVLLQAQEINATEHATQFPPGMLLAGQGGTTPSTGDSTGTTAVLNTTVITQGAYTLFVGSSIAGQTGSYTLQVQ